MILVFWMLNFKPTFSLSSFTFIKRLFSSSSLSSISVVSSAYRRRQWHPTPVLLPGKSHRRRSLEGCNPWGRWGSETTEWLHFHFSLSCIGEGNGNPLQCSCLENPRDGGAWWAAVYGVAQSRIQLKLLSSSSSSNTQIKLTWMKFVKILNRYSGYMPETNMYCKSSILQNKRRKKIKLLEFE